MTAASTWDEAKPEDRIDHRRLQLERALVDATQLHQLPKAEPLIDEVLYRDSLSWLYGTPGHGKSFVALDWACHIATGRHWHNHETQQGRVLYIVAEGAQGMQDRVKAWETRHQQIPDGLLLFLPVAVQLLSKVDPPALEQLVREIQPALIVVDTQARTAVGAEENSAKDMGELVAALDALRVATGACVLTVHHSSKAGEQLRGSSAIEGAATTIIRAKKDGALITLENTKQKDGPEFDAIVVVLATVELDNGRSAAAVSHEAMRQPTLLADSTKRILDLLRDTYETTGVSASALEKDTGLSHATVARALKALINAGLARNEGSRNRSKYFPNQEESLL